MTRSHSNLEFEEIAPEIALELLGEPKQKTTTHWRWGNKGSLAFELETASFFDFESNQGGGVTWLIERQGLSPKDVLSKYQQTTNNKIKKNIKSFTDKDMFDLKSQSEIFIRYSENFCVMRFPIDHYIKQKYAPFVKENDLWFMKRPNTKLPLYISNKNPEGYVIINEGEKAVLGCESIVKDKADSCCWHGGVNNIDNIDWTPLTNRKVIIFPDNDEAGKKCSSDIKNLIEDIAEEVKIVKVPRSFNDKDDLYDAKINDFFKSPEEFLDYCLHNEVKKRVSFELLQINRIIKDIKPADWLIKDIFERDSIVSIFGQAKSGKSFVTVDMATCVANGKDWYGHKTKKSAVVYLAGEGNRNISRRFKAYESLNDTTLGNAPLFISTRGARLLDDKDHSLLKDTVNQVADNYDEVGMIVIDTLQRNFGQGNENSTEDMSAFIERVDDLKDEYNAAIVLVHHSGHGTTARARGSSVIQASVDWEYKVVRSDIGSQMYVELSQTLVKDGVPMQPKNFKFVEQKLTFIDDMTSGALEITDNIPKPAKINDTDQKIINIIYNAQSAVTDPEQFWLRQSEIDKLIPDVKTSTVKSCLKKLRENNTLNYDTNKGYQTKDWDNKIF